MQLTKKQIAFSDGKLPEETVRLMASLAAEAKQKSYSPYSKFRVGASVLASSGSIYLGTNVENASYGGAICAERTAFVKAVSEGDQSFLAVFVTSDQDVFISPCGFCRQFMVEFGKECLVYLVDVKGRIKEPMSLEVLLPLSFGPANLLG
jgi:cytidine deaminase